MPRLGVWGTLWAARESSYWFFLQHAEHGEIEEPVWRVSASTGVERKSKYQKNIADHPVGRLISTAVTMMHS